MSCTLILLPGMDGTGELFSPLVKELGPDIQTVVVRYPDLLVTKAAAEAFAKTAVNARVADIEGPHLLLQTNPVDAARVLRTFVHEVGAVHPARRNATDGSSFPGRPTCTGD